MICRKENKMGHYSGFRMKATLKPEAIEVVEFLFGPARKTMDQDCNDPTLGAWRTTWKEFPDFWQYSNRVEHYAQMYKCDMIPFGYCCFWEKPEDSPEWNSRIEGDQLIIRCSSKNPLPYESFLELVAPELIESCSHCESASEFSKFTNFYEFINGEFRPKQLSPEEQKLRDEEFRKEYGYYI